MKFIDRGTVPEDWASLPVFYRDGKGVGKLQLSINPHGPALQRLIALQDSEPILVSAFFTESGQPPDEWPEIAIFVYRRRLVELVGTSHVVADPGQRRELLLRIKKWVLLKETRLAGLERDVASLEAVRDERGPQRTAIPAATRVIVFERDEGKCVVCGSTSDLQFDHIIPVVKGGGNSVENLQVLCGRCNREKGENLA